MSPRIIFKFRCMLRSQCSENVSYWPKETQYVLHAEDFVQHFNQKLPVLPITRTCGIGTSYRLTYYFPNEQKQERRGAKSGANS